MKKRYILRASDLAIRKNYSAEKCFEGTVLKILKHYQASDIFSFIDSFACNSSCVFVKLNDVILKERSKKFNIPQKPSVGHYPGYCTYEYDISPK